MKTPITIHVLLLLASAAAVAAPSQAISAALEAEERFMASRRQVSLQEALKLGAANNHDLKAARAQATQLAAKAGLAVSAVLPEVSASLSYVGTSAPALFDNGGQLDLLAALTRGTVLPPEAQQQILTSLAASPRSMTIQATHSVFGSLLVQQVLFSPQFFLLPAADEVKQAAELGALEAREQVLLAIARVYLGLEGLAQIERAAREAEQIALKREHDAQAQVNAGTQTEIAVLRAQSETAQARSTLASLSGNRVALTAMLEALVGAPVRPAESAPTQLAVVAADEGSQPWERLYSVRSASFGLQAQRRFNTVDRLSILPNLVAQAKGSYNSNRGFVNTNFIFDGIIAAQWVLYDRGVRYVTMRENDAKTAQQAAQLEGARVKAKAGWVGATTNLAAAQVALEQAESQAQLAAKAQRQLGSAFQAGLATSLEVSDIDNKAFFAASAAAQARAQYEIRKVELAAAEGRLAEVLGLGTAE